MVAKMSQGMTPAEFVQQVYYMQEKTLLEFWPTDDKYREVMVEANLVLQELEALEDWTWLRETINLGYCEGNTSEILKFELPDDVYKLSTLNHDFLRLYPIAYHDIQTTTELVPYEEVTHTVDNGYVLDEHHYIPVPLASAGDQRWNREQQVNWLAMNHVHDWQLRAVVHGHTIMFNRPLTNVEANMVLVADVQKRIKRFHVCDYRTCEIDPNTHICSNADSVYLTEIPDPNYVVMATAARHAEGSPPALARVAGIQDAAQRILSQMRSNDASATDSDYIEWDTPGYIEVI